MRDGERNNGGGEEEWLERETTRGRKGGEQGERRGEREAPT